MRPARAPIATIIQPWGAVASGVPDIPINDCAKMLTGRGGSGACEQSRQVGTSEETALFVREMKHYSSTDDDAAHPNQDDGSKIRDVRKKVDYTLTIMSNDSKMNTWVGFKTEGALFLRGNGWDDMDIRESVVAALDLAEEQLGCHTVYLCLEKSNPHLAALVRTLMYAGFEVVHPGVLEHVAPKYLVLGIEL
ncbi:acyl-CoA N-acyltransferase [Dissophora ornata]|nr:acyl-CoA N-acyltransferase [Dissophora ornata]